MERVGASAALLHRLWPADRTAGLPRPHPRWRAYPVTGRLAAAVGALPVPDGLRRHAWSLSLVAAYARGYRHAERFIPALRRG
jgi:hypothetical protein